MYTLEHQIDVLAIPQYAQSLVNESTISVVIPGFSKALEATFFNVENILRPSPDSRSTRLCQESKISSLGIVPTAISDPALGTPKKKKLKKLPKREALKTLPQERLDALGAYLKSLKYYPSLTKEEYARVMEMRRLDYDAYASKLYHSNLRLVVWVAKRFLGRLSEGSALEYMDLIQEGNAGLLKAVTMFDPDKGFRFTTYATWWVKQFIARFYDDHWRSVRIPVHMMESIRRYVKVSNRLTHELGGDPTRDEVSAELNITSDKAASLKFLIDQSFLSISGMNQETEGYNPLNFLESDEKAPDIFTSDTLLSTEVRKAIKMVLTPKEYDILMMRFSLDNYGRYSLKEIAEKYGVSRQRIDQIETKVIAKLSGNPDLLKLARSCNFRIKPEAIELAKQKMQEEKDRRFSEDLESALNAPKVLKTSEVGKEERSESELRSVIETHSNPAYQKLTEKGWGKAAMLVLTSVCTSQSITIREISSQGQHPKILFAKQLAAYLLTKDFSIQNDEIADLFSLSDPSEIQLLSQEIEGRLEEGSVLQILNSIRKKYTLGMYADSDVVTRYQKHLFAGQLEEAKKRLLKIEKDLRTITKRLDDQAVTGRTKDIFMARYYVNGNPAEGDSLEEVAKQYDLKREQVRQVVNVAWMKISVEKTTAFNSLKEFEAKITELKKWKHLIFKSEMNLI